MRKTAPKEVPFKAYIYETYDKKYVDIGICWEKGKCFEHGCKKVIGEFVCDCITDIKPFGFDDIVEFEKQTCLTSADIVKYLNGFYGYGWHISDLKIYDKPKELSDFYVHKYDRRDYCDGCVHHECPVTEYPCCECCADERNRAYLYRPPQSWCYVEELQNV